MKAIFGVLILSSFLVSCGKSNETKKTADQTIEEATDVTLTETWDHPPTSNTENNTVVLTLNANDTAIEVTDIDPQMPTHGHGTVKTHQKITVVNAQNPTTVRVTGLYFIMPGPWVIDVIFKANGTLKKTSFSVEVK